MLTNDCPHFCFANFTATKDEKYFSPKFAQPSAEMIRTNLIKKYHLSKNVTCMQSENSTNEVVLQIEKRFISISIIITESLLIL